MMPTSDKKYFIVTQLRSTVKPAQYPRKLKAERRIAMWRAFALFVSALAFFLFLLAFEFLDFIPALFGWKAK